MSYFQHLPNPMQNGKEKKKSSPYLMIDHEIS